MTALSIRQPWAWLIATGWKDIENRTWPTNFRGWCLIHAGATVPKEAEIRAIETEFGVNISRSELRYGGLIGTMRVTDCVKRHRSRWFEGPFGFVLEGAEPHPLLRCRGMLQFFDTEDALGQQSIPEVTQK